MYPLLWRHAALALLTSLIPLHAALQLPRVFGDHMVLQRDKPIPLWGWADPGATVTVAFNGTTQTATTAPTGRWELKLPAMKASSTPLIMTLHSNDQSLTLSDVLLGDVWICAGQSNMDFPLAGANGGHEALTAAGQLTQIRLLHVTAPASGLPADDIPNAWTPCTSSTVANFSAVAFFFGKAVSEKIGVPVGLIQSAWGGTPIQPWTPEEGFALDDKLRGDLPALNQAEKELHATLAARLPEMENWVDKAKRAVANNTDLPALPSLPPDPLVPFPTNPNQDTVIFNSRIHPLIPYAIRGVIWYQGESNHGDTLYANRLRALISSWRQLWGEGDFPFYFVQLAPLGTVYAKGELVDLWQAQSSCLDLPNTGMAVTNDIGDLTTIHPKDKRDVGERLARIAFTKEYGLPDIVYSGPVYHSMQIDGAKIRLTFDHGDGLASRDGQPLSWFELAGADGKFVAADAVIEGQQVVVSSAQVPAPKAVRFAWANNAVPNLVNHAGLPTPAFQASQP